MIIQSLPNNDSTGADLYNAMLPIAVREGWPRPRLYTPRDASAFFSLLRDIEAESRTEQFEPSIQIEAHGVYHDESEATTDGIALESNGTGRRASSFGTPSWGRTTCARGWRSSRLSGGEVSPAGKRRHALLSPDYGLGKTPLPQGSR